jgi:PAS domain S-box-containing protein
MCSDNELDNLAIQVNGVSNALSDSVAALKEREERLTPVITNDGIWDWNLTTNEVYYSPRWKAMLGYEDWEVSDSFEAWERLIHPDDLERARTALQAYLTGHSQRYRLEHRLRHKDGAYRWLLARGTARRAVCTATGHYISRRHSGDRTTRHMIVLQMW